MSTLMVAIWAVLGAATLVLGVYRIFFAVHNEEDVIRLAAGEEADVRRQLTVSRKLGDIDRWGQMLTVITVVIGLGLAGSYLYDALNNPHVGSAGSSQMNAQ